MDETAKTRYAAVGDADIAYQVVGDGPLDLLYSYGLGSHIEHLWDMPMGVDVLRRLSSFSRLILFDRRGSGASDGIPRNAFPTWEEWTEDVGAVLDAAGSERAAVLGAIEAGPIAILFAATHPERVSDLVLLNTSARYLVADDYPIGEPPERLDAIVKAIGRGWGNDEVVRMTNPSIADDPELVRRLARMIRASATPRTAVAQYNYILGSLDVRQALPLIQARTLVLNVRHNGLTPSRYGRYLADHINGARFVELSGGDSGMTSAMADEVAQFLTGERPIVEVDRILTTVLFSDIASSTERATQLGDRAWKGLLDRYRSTVREHLHRFRGREINTRGDDFLATFDGPARAIRCALAIAQATRAMGLEVRSGLHIGEVELMGEDIGGIAVHIGARVSELAGPGQVLVSRMVTDLVAGSGIKFADQGEHELKGVPGTWRLFSVEG